MTRTDARGAVRAAARVGEFFAVEIDPADSWVPLRTLLTDGAVLGERVSRTRHSLAASSGGSIDAVPIRTAASVDHLALTARVLAVALGACVVGRVALRLSPDDVRYARQRIGVTNPVGRLVTVERAPQAIGTEVVDTVLAPLIAAYAARFRLSTQVLRGNVASALNGAVEVLDASGVEQSLPAAPIAAALLRTPALSGTVRSTSPRFVRNSCCLWYRIPGGRLCGDCVLSA